MQKGFEALPQYIKSTYYYYEGLLSLFQFNYLNAEKSLTLSLETWNNTQENFIKNVYSYLIPLNILLGIYPPKALIEKYKLTEFSSLSIACQGGSLGLYEWEMAKLEEKFLKVGIYLFMEKLRNLVLRNMVMKLVEENEGSHILKLQLLTERYNHSLEEVKWKEFQASEDDKVDIIGIEWILSGLIYKGYIKGYISNEKQILVLSKKEPFPALRSVIENNGQNI